MLLCTYIFTTTTIFLLKERIYLCCFALVAITAGPLELMHAKYTLGGATNLLIAQAFCLFEQL